MEPPMILARHPAQGGTWPGETGWPHVNYCRNSLKRGYLGDYVQEYDRGS